MTQLPEGQLVETGDAAVDAALQPLRSLDPDTAPSDALPVLTAVHDALQHRLTVAAE